MKSLQCRVISGLLCLLLLAVAPAGFAAEADTPIRVGIIGLDTSHVIAFTKIMNDPNAEGDLADVRVVAAFPGGSPDIPSSWDRVGKYTEQLRSQGVEICDSIPAMLEKVDAVLLESLDGRPHLEQGETGDCGRQAAVYRQAAGRNAGRRDRDFPPGRGERGSVFLQFLAPGSARHFCRRVRGSSARSRSVLPGVP